VRCGFRRGAQITDPWRHCGSLQEAHVKSLNHDNSSRSYRKWTNAGAGLEAVLFASVQVVMLVCLVLVATQLIVTA